MKYKLLYSVIGTESDVNEENNYSVEISLALLPTDDIVPQFTKTFTSISNNFQTGFEVDKQRQTEIDAYVIEINK